jgi:hypothetical protein
MNLVAVSLSVNAVDRRRVKQAAARQLCTGSRSSSDPWAGQPAGVSSLSCKLWQLERTADGPRARPTRIVAQTPSVTHLALSVPRRRAQAARAQDGACGRSSRLLLQHPSCIAPLGKAKTTGDRDALRSGVLYVGGTRRKPCIRALNRCCAAAELARPGRGRTGGLSAAPNAAAEADRGRCRPARWHRAAGGLLGIAAAHVRADIL